MKLQDLTTDLKILLADDDKDDRFFFKKALHELPVVPELKMVTDGEKLMTYLLSYPDPLPDIIFLDINMPRKNGVECLTEIKHDERLKQIPVIIYSTSAYDSVAAALYEKGAHYYLQKCDYSELISSIRGIVELLLKHPKRPTRDKFFYRCHA